MEPTHASLQRHGNIIVVEDELIVARDIEATLLHSGFNVVGIYSAIQEAINGTYDRTPDLAIMDIGLAEGPDGVTGAAELRRLFDVPVVFVTAYADTGTLARAKETEPLGYLTKPFKRDDLRCVIELALDRAQKRRELAESLNTLWRAATHDPVTGLLARNEFATRLALIRERARVFRHKARPALLLLAVDGLENAAMRGLEARDAALSALAARLQAVLPPRDAACYYGANVFAIVLNVCATEREARCRAETIVHALSEPLPGLADVRIAYGIALDLSAFSDLPSALMSAEADLRRNIGSDAAGRDRSLHPV